MLQPIVLPAQARKILFSKKLMYDSTHTVPPHILPHPPTPAAMHPLKKNRRRWYYFCGLLSSPLFQGSIFLWAACPGEGGTNCMGRLPPETQKLGGGKGGRWHFYFGKEARTSCWWWHQVTHDRYVENSPFESEPLKQTNI